VAGVSKTGGGGKVFCFSGGGDFVWSRLFFVGGGIEGGGGGGGCNNQFGGVGGDGGGILDQGAARPSGNLGNLSKSSSSRNAKTIS